MAAVTLAGSLAMRLTIGQADGLPTFGEAIRGALLLGGIFGLIGFCCSYLREDMGRREPSKLRRLACGILVSFIVLGMCAFIPFADHDHGFNFYMVFLTAAVTGFGTGLTAFAEFIGGRATQSVDGH